MIVWILICPDPKASPEPTDPNRVEAKGLHNVFRITPTLFSGSSPEGDEGFQSLCDLGVKTVISVDGAKPDLEGAKRFGLRYVHLPFGYDGIPRERVLELAKAVRDLPGPIYLHCHHGKHRGPAAAAAVHFCLDEKCTIEQALAEMKRAGTDRRYKGLFQVIESLRRPSAQELDRLVADYPEVVKVASLAQSMVKLDESWDRLQQVQAAGWQAPPKHPDVDPPHEALQLLEGFREINRLPAIRKRPRAFQDGLADAEKAAQELENIFRAGKGNHAVDKRAADKAFESVRKNCAECHAKYRDVPQQP
jgi:protein tyrosine phosphatase (PTP) superfamily phosphohydrolase (DUF442 family)